MKHRTLHIVAGLAVVFGTLAFAWAQPDGGPKDAPPADRQPGERQPGGPGGPFDPGRMLSPGGMLGGRDAFAEAVGTLGELNLEPAFTLTKEQKEKIQSIRDAHRTAIEKWRTDHEADFKKMREQMEGMRPGGNMRDRWQEMNKLRETVMASAPKADEPIKQLKAVLTEDQVKQLEQKMTERKAEAEKMRREFQDRFQRGGRGGDGGRGGRGGGRGGDGGERPRPEPPKPGDL